MNFSKYIDIAAGNYAKNNQIAFDEAYDALMSVIFDSNCDVLGVIDWNLYPQPDEDFVW